MLRAMSASAAKRHSGRKVIAILVGLALLFAAAVGAVAIAGRERSTPGPSLIVIAPATGLDVEGADREVALRITTALRGAPGVEHVRSVATDGSVRVSVHGTPDVRSDELAAQVRARLASLSLEGGALLRLAADPPVRWVTAPPEQARLLIDVVRPRLEALDGVGEVSVCGERQHVMTVWVDEARLRALGLTIGALARAMAESHTEVPAGRLAAGAQELAIRTSAGARTAEELGAIVIAARDGVPTHVRDVARVERGLRPPACLARRGGEVVSLAVSLQAELEDRGAVLARLDEAIARLAAEHGVRALEGEVTTGRARALGTLEERAQLGLALGRVLERDALIEVDRSGLRVAMAGASEVGIARAMASVPGLRVEGPVVAAVTGEREQALGVARELRDRWAHAGCDALLLDEEQAEETRVTIDRARAGELGVDAMDLARAVAVASETGLAAGSMQEDDESIPIVLRLEGQRAGTPHDLANLLVPARQGTVPLASVARIELARGPARLVRRDGIPSFEIAASGERAREAFDEAAGQIRLPVDVVVSLETTRGAERL